MHMVKVGFLATLLTLLSPDLGECSVTSNDAAICVYVSTTFGDPVGDVLVKLKSDSTGKEFKKTGTEIRFDRVPFDIYQIEIQKANFATRRERVRISQPEVSLRFGLQVGRTHPEKADPIEGSIVNWQSSHGETWVRLVPLYSNELIEARIEKSGSFKFEGVEPGKYALLIFRGDKVAATKMLEYFGSKISLQLTLSDMK